jgi:hypothetical protein
MQYWFVLSDDDPIVDWNIETFCVVVWRKHLGNAFCWLTFELITDNARN